MSFTILHGNNLDILPTLPDNSVDSIVTDPPYELGFMGKKWDSSGIAYSVQLWTECLRVLKPGGHLLSFGGTRTYHRVAVAIEDAGFEIRDNMAWLYGSGFPKSLDVSKAIDKAAGAERERVPYVGGIASGQNNYGGGGKIHLGSKVGDKALTPEAEQWNGWGTALKPAHEPIIVARKPLIGTVAHNVLTHGTGALNIDGSRIASSSGENFARPVNFTGMNEGWARPWMQTAEGQATNAESRKQSEHKAKKLGRWPANIILDEHTAGLLDEQSGVSKSTPAPRGEVPIASNSMSGAPKTFSGSSHNDSGGASRFFYVAKASKRDRNEGLEGLEDKANSKFAQDKWSLENMSFGNTAPAKNFHPTVKPTALMEYLVKLVTPPNGTVLDPFTGSGSTGKAAILNGFDFIGIEMTEDYLPIIDARLKHAETEFAEAHADKGLF
jgi:site-specific DNA-methyltransferase (adenine-specific)